MKDSERKKTIEAAKNILNSDYAKKHNENYSAAVLTSVGNVYPGIAYFSDTYSLTLHGEQAALSHAASHGEVEVVAIAVASNEKKKKGEFTNPCHMCKQLLYESQLKSGLKIIVILLNNHGETKEVLLDEMVSYPWPVKSKD